VELTNINDDNKIQKNKGIRRSLKELKKRYYIGNSDKKISSLVEVVEIENYKELNKLLNFDIPEENENIKGSQETVCCSGICLIY
jgi:hypothetical protein